MKSYDKNLKLAQTICDEIKTETVCSNDIIPRHQMPWLTQAMIPDVKQKFGSDKVDAYCRHLHYLNSVREMLAAESESKKMRGSQSSAAMGVAYLGVGECGELSTLAFMKLIARGRRDVAIVAVEGKKNKLDPMNIPFYHAFILLGINDMHCLQDCGDIQQLNALSNHIVILDPLLNHVGRAADYLKDQSPYLTVFGYYKVCFFQVVTQTHIDNYLLTEDNARQLLAYAETKGVLPFERALCDLPLANNPSLKKYPCEETALLQGLNTRSGLIFSGVADERCRVDAVTEIHSDEQAATAKRIQSQLSTGCFYTGAAQRFFVIHNINVPVSSSNNLPRRIHDSYC